MLTYALVLNYNSVDETLELYDQLKRFYSEELQILIIDNNSEKEDILKLKKNIPSQQLLLSNKNLGYAGGNNLGIKSALKAGAEYIWVLNPDIRVDRTSLKILRESLIKDETLAAIGPRIVQRENKDKIFCDGGLVIFNSSCSTILKNHNKSCKDIGVGLDYDISYIDGSSILFRSETFKRIGLLPQKYFLYFEETDWCFRAREKGWRLAINSNASVFNLSTLKNSRYIYYTTRNRLIFAKKYHPKFSKVRKHYLKAILKDSYNSIAHGQRTPHLKNRILGIIAGNILAEF